MNEKLFNSDVNLTESSKCSMRFPEISDESEVCVIGGRDHNLLRSLANKMNFKIEYLEPLERTQGLFIAISNSTLNMDKKLYNFTGGLGMIQNRVTKIPFRNLFVVYIIFVL